MSWLRSAVNKAVEVGGKNTLTRTVRNYADTVVHHAGHAVAEGAKILQDRFVARNFRSFKHTVKRLEEVSVSCRGPERVQLLKRWLVVLKEIESISESAAETTEKVPGSPRTLDDMELSPRKASLILFYDADVGGEPMTFRDVFLHSQALEGITLNMILEAPTDEEVNLLLEIFALALTGGKEVHNAIVSSIQDLAKSFSTYDEEVLVKREELLQFAQSAITGLKLNADLTRIDAEALVLEQKLYKKNTSESPSAEDTEDAAGSKAPMSTKGLKEALEDVRICSTLEGLLLKKKLINIGDSAEIHSQKIDKLKILSESLASSIMKAEKRISDHRHQKEEALKFRVAKANETNEIEKELEEEVAQLEKQRDKLEAELKRINISLAAALARLRNTREEKEQFDEANNQIISHLNTKEGELSRSIAACKTESDVVRTWINFLEDTWLLQSSYAEQKEISTKNELDKTVKHFTGSVLKYLHEYKGELKHAILDIQRHIDGVNKFSERLAGTSYSEAESLEISNQRKKLQAEYLESEAMILTTFSVVDNMREHFYSQHGSSLRQDDSEVREAFDALEHMRRDFESIQRPPIEFDETSTKKGTMSSAGGPESPSHVNEQKIEVPSAGMEDAPPSVTVASYHEQTVDPESELAKLESEFGKVSKDYSAEEIGGWEFDELEQELNSGEASAGK
ncbi:uncharacterized protein LOC116254244 [Nymphaea colorata]|nr:uncharacterized protein LOC116254244 [Nymphaea colorata]